MVASTWVGELARALQGRIETAVAPSGIGQRAKNRAKTARKTVETHAKWGKTEAKTEGKTVQNGGKNGGENARCGPCIGQLRSLTSASKAG